MFADLGKPGRWRRIQGKFLWKVSGRNNLIKALTRAATLIKAK